MDNLNNHNSQTVDLSLLISLSEAAVLCSLSASHLRLLVRQGKLWGMKVGRNWVTSEAAVKEYLSTDRRPGPKPAE